MLKIVHILEATDGGTRTHILQLLRGLDKGLYQQTLIASAQRNPLFRREMETLKSEGIEVIEVPMVRQITPVQDIKSIMQLAGVLQQRRDSIIHTHASKAGALGRITARCSDCPCIIHTPHAFFFEGKRGISRLAYKWIERGLLRLTSRLVLLSEGQRQTAIHELSADPERVAVIPNGVDTERFVPPADKAAARALLGITWDGPVVGCIMRFVPQKGNSFMLRAFAEVFAGAPSARALIVGDGPDRNATMTSAKKLGIFEKITWIQRHDQPELLYAAMDVLALASLYEGMPYTLLEAMSSGIPPVATDIPGVAEVIEEGVSGFKVLPRKSTAMAQRITTLLEDSDLAAKVGAAARARIVGGFDKQRFLAAMGAFYDSTAAASGMLK